MVKTKKVIEWIGQRDGVCPWITKTWKGKKEKSKFCRILTGGCKSEKGRFKQNKMIKKNTTLYLVRNTNDENSLKMRQF